MEKMITELTVKIKFDNFAADSKSESKRPYLITANGEKILLYKKNDNPFENKGFTDFVDKEVILTGEFNENTFIVSEIVLKNEQLVKEEAGK